MKLLGISASPRKGKSTFFVLEKTFDEVRKSFPEMDMEIIELGGLEIKGCNDCALCKKELDCSIKDDFTGLIDRLKDLAVRGMIIATPVYMGSMTSLCKAFLDRSAIS